MPRKYVKRNKEYWNNLGKIKGSTVPIVSRVTHTSTPDPIAVEMAEGHVITNVTQRTSARFQHNLNEKDAKTRFPNINAGILPFKNNNGVIDVSEAIELTQKVWANFLIVQNAIEAQVEFSNTPIHFSSTNKTFLKFVEKWAERIDLQQFAEEFFREFYRSNNVFINRLDGAIENKQLKMLQELIGAIGAENSIPVRYIILNPAFIGAENLSSSKTEYVKKLTPFEIARLKKPETDADRVLFDALDEKSKRAIRREGTKSVTIKLDPAKVSAIFYRKQDYEPMAIPSLWGILDDIEYKMNMKQVDIAVSQQIENSILLITSGSEELPPDPKKFEVFRQLFQVPSLQRILVSDYTTKAAFIIPDLNKILGKQKYEAVNQDIKDALQSIIFAEERFSNQMAKARIFMEKLAPGRRKFKKFLQSEIARIKKNMGFNGEIEIKFEKINLKDEVQLQRIFNRLAELGFLSPDETFRAHETGILPTKEESEKAQKEFLEKKDERLYIPQTQHTDPAKDEGGDVPEESGRPPGSEAPQETQTIPVFGEERYAVSNIGGTIDSLGNLKKKAEASIKKQYKIKRLNKKHKELADFITTRIANSLAQENWDIKLDEIVKTQKIEADEKVNKSIIEIAAKHQINPDLAAILYHSQEFNSQNN